MKTKNMAVLGAVSLLTIGAVLLVQRQQSSETELLLTEDAKTLALGQDVYAQNCAACHGVNLEGAPDWRQRGADGLMPAPPHDASGHTWHHDSETLFNVTKYGLAKLIGDETYRSGMPAYEGVLTDAEVIAALSFIRASWPEEIRTKYDAREAAR